MVSEVTSQFRDVAAGWSNGSQANFVFTVVHSAEILAPTRAASRSFCRSDDAAFSRHTATLSDWLVFSPVFAVSVSTQEGFRRTLCRPRPEVFTWNRMT